MSCIYLFLFDYFKMQVGRSLKTFLIFNAKFLYKHNHTLVFQYKAKDYWNRTTVLLWCCKPKNLCLGKANECWILKASWQHLGDAMSHFFSSETYSTSSFLTSPKVDINQVAQFCTNSNVQKVCSYWDIGRLCMETTETAATKHTHLVSVSSQSKNTWKTV